MSTSTKKNSMSKLTRQSKTAINSIPEFNITTLKKRKSNSQRTFLNNIQNYKKRTLKHLGSKKKYNTPSMLQMQIEKSRNGLKHTPKRKSSH
jgi:hypothetical protein